MQGSALCLFAPLTWLVVGLHAGCTGMPAVDYNFDPDTDFSRWHEYAWAPSQAPRLEGARVDDRALDERIKRATDASLASRGFSKVELAEADFLVAYSVRLEDRTLHFDALPQRWGDGPQDFEYKVGTLSILIADPNSERMLWRGSLQSEVDTQSPGKRVERAVARILEPFPPRP